MPKGCLGALKCTKHRCISKRPSPPSTFLHGLHSCPWSAHYVQTEWTTVSKSSLQDTAHPFTVSVSTGRVSKRSLGGLYYVFISRATVFMRGKLGVAPEWYTCVYMDAQVIGPAPLPFSRLDSCGATVQRGESPRSPLYLTREFP